MQLRALHPDTEIFDIRHFTGVQLRPLLEEETRYWAERMSWDYRDSAEMILRYIDTKVLPGYVALDKEQVVGYSFFVYEGPKAVIGDLFASHSDEGRALEHRLLENVIQTLQCSPGLQRIEAQLLLYATGSASSAFEENGFKSFPRLFMRLPLGADAPVPKVKMPPGFVMRGWLESDFHTAATLITAAYRGHVDASINDQYCSVSGSLRFLNNIVRFPGCGVFDPGSSYVVVDQTSNQMVGVLLCSRVREDVGHVTQVCVLPEYRGRGIGEAMIARCCQELQRRRFSALTLTVTEANNRAVELYLRHGFETKRVFDAYVWDSRW